TIRDRSRVAADVIGRFYDRLHGARNFGFVCNRYASKSSFPSNPARQASARQKAGPLVITDNQESRRAACSAVSGTGDADALDTSRRRRRKQADRAADEIGGEARASDRR